MSELITDFGEAETTLRDLTERFRESPLSTTETYSLFEANDEESVQRRKEQKRLFLAGEIRNPDLNFPKLENPDVIESIEQEETLLLELMRDSTELAHDQDREAVLYDLLRIRRLEMGMVLLAKDFCDPAFDTTRSSETADLYNRVNDEINGPLEVARFNGLLLKHQGRAKRLLEEDNTPEEIRRAATYFIENTGQVSKGDAVTWPVKVNEGRFNDLQKYFEERFDDILQCVPSKPDGEKFNAEEVADIFRKAHELRGTGWHVIVQPGKSNIDSRQSDKTTIVGADRQRTARNTRGILVHENGVHVQRRVNGDKLGDPLLAGLGLPWYLAPEEGITKISQQAIEGKVKDSGEQYYLAIGLSRGFDGRPRDFRDIYELELARRLMSEHIEKDDDISEEDKIRSQSYEVALRVRRGTRAEVPGVAYTKDGVYYLGNQMMWKAMLRMVDMPENHRDEMFNLLLAAKYDPNNTLHLKIVQRAIG